jgi:hypothetical protein
VKSLCPRCFNQSVVFLAAYNLQLDRSFFAARAIANPPIETGLERPRRVLAEKSHRDRFEERALAGAVIAGEHCPAGIRAVLAAEVEIDFREASDVLEDNLFYVHTSTPKNRSVFMQNHLHPTDLEPAPQH